MPPPRCLRLTPLRRQPPLRCFHLLDWLSLSPFSLTPLPSLRHGLIATFRYARCFIAAYADADYAIITHAPLAIMMIARGFLFLCFLQLRYAAACSLLLLLLFAFAMKIRCCHDTLLPMPLS